MELMDKVTVLPGVGEKTAKLLKKLGVETVFDLLNHIPRDFIKYPPISSISEAGAAERGPVALKLSLVSELSIIRTPRVNILKAMARESGSLALAGGGRAEGTGQGGMGEGSGISLKWYNMPFLKNVLHSGMTRVFYGKTVKGRDGLSMEHPRVFTAEEYAGIMEKMEPVYPLTEGISSKSIAKWVGKALEKKGIIADLLKEDEREALGLLGEEEAISSIHRPKDMEEWKKARKRLAFDEFLSFIINVQRLKDERGAAANSFPIGKTPIAESLKEKLPWKLTASQEKALSDVMGDLRGSTAMNRLIQGDVGSIVAVLALLSVAENGFQGTMMAPTEVLAAQHAEKIRTLFRECSIPFPVYLLTGSLSLKEKREVKKKIASGEACIVLGTHALIQEDVYFPSLALAVTDEQHRFGVGQRKELSKRGGDLATGPHVLVMSATPIPRTLGLILYGDLDISVMEGRPTDRLPIKNCVIGPSKRQSAYKFIFNEIKSGHQAYIICPLVEPSESMQIENVPEYAEKLKAFFGQGVRIAVLHGRMPPKEKNAVMESFKRHEADILVSTTVVEVGVDVPNATVIMIEDAERFGLSTLHQIRGRVGRGDAQSYCIFVDTSPSAREKGQDMVKSENERLQLLVRTVDGFEIAEEDLKMRGPGDFFGIRQSGDMDFRIADIYGDADMLTKAASFVKGIKRERFTEIAGGLSVGNKGLALQL